MSALDLIGLLALALVLQPPRRRRRPTLYELVDPLPYVGAENVVPLHTARRRVPPVHESGGAVVLSIAGEESARRGR